MSVEQQQQVMQAQAAEAAAGEYDEEEYEEEYVGGGHRYLLFTAMPGWLISMVVHAVVLMVLAILTFGPDLDKVKAVITSGPPAEELEEIEEFQEQLIEPVDVEAFDTITDITPIQMISDSIPEDVTEVSVADDLDQAAITVDLFDFGEETAPKNDLTKEIGSYTGTGLDGRGTAASRAAAVKAYGGNEASESAVAAGLRWIADHQLPDGGWSFDHRFGPIINNRPRTSPNPGNLAENGRNGATAMAVLPFLGAGQTHMSKDSPYQQVVKGGLMYLATHMKKDGSLHESGGSMYSHGLAAIALCEAYAMTHDRDLMMPAQAALNFIVYAQDPIGGGWRYSPRTPGDTSVVGWQVMALKSGHLAYLNVPKGTVLGAIKFLDTVQMNSGAYYGYTTPAKRSTTTAVGLLCRMYLGWKREHGALQEGVEYLAQTGPDPHNMYYNYYATQVMRQVGGERWDEWNSKMRDPLVAAQEKAGPAQGSWFFAGGHGADRGGRLYNTSLSTMILEVYYRHMPIYQDQATTEDFPL
jgi:hypothetical protein